MALGSLLDLTSDWTWLLIVKQSLGIAEDCNSMPPTSCLLAHAGQWRQLTCQLTAVFLQQYKRHMMRRAAAHDVSPLWSFAQHGR